METKETLLRSFSDASILEDIDYYKYIFKKTEKIVCAVLYILRSDKQISHDDRILRELEASSVTLLGHSLLSLRNTVHTITGGATELKYGLIELESKLRVASSARFLSPDLLEVFVHEIDSVQRALRKYTEPKIANPLTSVGIDQSIVSSVRRVPRIKHKISDGGTESVEGQGTSKASRRERVLDVIKDRQEATIKDIVSVITDCSEKTIQRELTALIKDNIIVREGERRWSKYKINFS